MIYKNINEIKKKIKYLILDLDGCLFDSRALSKYIPKNHNDREGWDIFHLHVGEESINEEIVDIISDLVNNGLREIYFVTSREDIGDIRLKTGLKIIEALAREFNKDIMAFLYMRQPYDYRSSDIVKNEIYIRDIKNQIDESKTLVIEDDKTNIAMYDSLGLDCLHYTKFVV